MVSSLPHRDRRALVRLQLLVLWHRERRIHRARGRDRTTRRLDDAAAGWCARHIVESQPRLIRLLPLGGGCPHDFATYRGEIASLVVGLVAPVSADTLPNRTREIPDVVGWPLLWPSVLGRCDTPF